MSDDDKKIVTYEDREVLQALLQGGFLPGWRDVVKRYLAAAEADVPPLRKGWALLNMDDRGVTRALYSDGLGTLWEDDSCEGTPYMHVREANGTLTPLRATISKADVEHAASVIWRATQNMSTSRAEDIFRDALKTADIEVSE